MSSGDPVAAQSELATLCERFASGGIDRRAFMRTAAQLGMAGAAAAVLPQLSAGAEAAELARQTAAAAARLPLDVAEWSYLWVNVKRAETARNAFVGGQQMYVEYMIPSQVRHPFPIVLVHGGGGQGTDWMGTPDGRPGWFQYLVSEGFKVYVVDRPGHGRSPLHPDLHGGFPATAAVLENIAGRFTPPSANPAATPNEYQKHASQWPGAGNVGSPDLDQLVAGQGGSYVVQQAPAGAGRQGGPPQGGAAPGGGARGGTPTPANAQPAGPLNLQHMVWRQAGADLLDKIGPAIIVTHSAGGPFGLLVAEARPTLVKATVIIEGAGSGFAGGNRWGMSSIPVTYDPPVADPSEIKTHWVASPEPGINGYFLQTEPGAHKLPNLRNTKVVFVTADSSFASPGNPGGAAFLKQAGVQAEELRLGTLGIKGNGHMMMVEKNSRQVLQPIIDWMTKNVTGSNSQSPAPRRGSGDSLALKLADTGIFWVGTNNKKKMPYGTIHVGQMFVQYLEPAEVRHPVPVLLVHGGGGQMVHYMGLGGASGWAHHFVQAGYKVYLVDRPGHGRSPFHPDALGEMGPLVTYDLLTRDTVTSAHMPNKQWPGTTGDVGDPLVEQLMAAANSALRDNQMAQTLWRTHGAELVDRIGPTILVTHSAGGPFGWLVANERPNLVKALVSFEGATAPLVGQGGAAGTPLPNLKGMPIMYLLSERGGRNGGPILEALTQSGAKAEVINLKDRGILGNSHFAMFENNRRQVFDVIRTWIEQRVPGGTSTARLE
ncbi:MAG TPA: alpha/beta fold hydrolase [Vicinamibacterales bacterium]|jgi:pimeloyl-ACP methyl ester carboxylesterase